MTQAYLSPWMEIKPEWIDWNDHLNMAYYHVLFDHGCDAAFASFGITREYIEQRQMTTFAAEFRIRYLRELKLGDKVRASFQILETTEKSFHYYMELMHEDGWLSATGEGITLHIDRSGPRVAPFPPEVMANIDAMYQTHKALPRPDHIDHVMRVRRSKG
ncbi:MAG: thioesterase family protein [Paracoccaceae bacterium]